MLAELYYIANLPQTEAECGARVTSLGWGWSPETGVVTPRVEPARRGEVPPTEEQLNRLTDFISFLEN